jgi:hypothetical protein
LSTIAFIFFGAAMATAVGALCAKKQQDKGSTGKSKPINSDGSAPPDSPPSCSSSQRTKRGLPSSTYDMDGSPTWLHTDLTKREAIDLLKADPAPESGMFLVRAKLQQAGQYVLDVAICTEGHLELEHYSIKRMPATNEFVIEDSTSRTGARTIETLMDELSGNTSLIRTPLVRGIADAREKSKRAVGDPRRQNADAHVADMHANNLDADDNSA